MRTTMLADWKSSIFTDEDVGNIHKILGISCLCSFLYRFYHFGEKDCNFGSGNDAVFFACHHLLLNLSSFIFRRLPEKRIVSGYRIWPEARLHALIFASRSLAFILLLFYKSRNDDNTTYEKSTDETNFDWRNLVLVLSTGALADIATASQKYPSRTIRDLHFPSLWKWWFSTIQFVGTAMCLLGPDRYMYHVIFVFVIQFNAFLMTLRRKNLASHGVLVSVYAANLLCGMLMLIWDDQYANGTHSVATIGITAAMIRFHMDLNKYVLWTLVFPIARSVQSHTGMLRETTTWWVIAHAASWGISIALGYNATRTLPRSFQPKAA